MRDLYGFSVCCKNMTVRLEGQSKLLLDENKHGACMSFVSAM